MLILLLPIQTTNFGVNLKNIKETPGQHTLYEAPRAQPKRAEVSREGKKGKRSLEGLGML